jgi:hypothetical protein
MKLYSAPRQPSSLQQCLKLLDKLTLVVRRSLASNPVASDEERKAIDKALRDASETLTGVARRTTASHSSLTENTDLYRMKDTELAAKWEGQQNEVVYISALATTMLERLHYTLHLEEEHYEALNRYWRSVSVQHLALLERWERAIT